MLFLTQAIEKIELSYIEMGEIVGGMDAWEIESH